MNAYSLKSIIALSSILAVAIVPTIASAANNTFVTAKINGDDQFKVHLSTLPTESGFQYVNGWGWSVTYTGKMLLPTDTAQNRWKEYWINVFVEDIGGFGPDLLGQFTLTGRSGCKFDNGSPTLLTDTRHWKVTEGQPQSYMQGAVHTGYPSWVTTYLPAFVQPTLIPASLGINGSGPSPWGVIPTNNLSAEWISAPGAPWNRAAWFQTHITCTP